jgi:hypothetical protein
MGTDVKREVHGFVWTIGPLLAAVMAALAAVQVVQTPQALVLWMLGAAGGCGVVQLAALRQWRHVGVVLLVYVLMALPVLGRMTGVA